MRHEKTLEAGSAVLVPCCCYMRKDTKDKKDARLYIDVFSHVISVFFVFFESIGKIVRASRNKLPGFIAEARGNSRALAGRGALSYRSGSRAPGRAVARFSDRPHNLIVGRKPSGARVCGTMRQWRFVTSHAGARFSDRGFVRSPETDDLSGPMPEHQLTTGERQ